MQKANNSDIIKRLDLYGKSANNESKASKTATASISLIVTGCILFTIKIADLNITIYNKYSFVENACAQYITDSHLCDFSVSVTEEELETERKISGIEFSVGYTESVCIYRNIALKLPEYNAFVIHCAAIEYDGEAYCFAAQSGVGKTTHIGLWRKVFGERVNIINGDKPIMRYLNNKLCVCGTPWSGKENLNSNIIIPLRGICFLQQSPNNSIIRLSPYEALGRLLKQVYLPQSPDLAAKTIEMVGNLLSQTPCWELKCNISAEAAMLAHKTMSNEE